jgi:hypothetical protein
MLLALVGAAVFVMLSSQSDSDSEPIAPGGNQNQKVIIDKGKISPKPIEVSSQYPVILIFHNFTSEKHEIVIKRLDEQGNELEELRRFELEQAESMNQRFSFKPGEYIIYCATEKGEHSHRKDGEETRIIVD